MTQRDSYAPVGPGDVLAGKYRVSRVLGAGGMGVVVEALHLELDERVAMKFLLPQAVGSPEAAARFLREARAAVKIKSEHVARVIDVGRLEDGAPYIVMEFLQGNDLAEVLTHGTLPLEDAVDYVLQACDAMAEAHSAGIVHRDLKPSNLFLTRRTDGMPVVKVLDFGISKLNVPDVSEAALTKTTAMMGSPFYMSPEQMRSAKDVDHRTDVWSLGVILFELLAGVPPFRADTLPALIATILSAPHESLLSHRPDLPPALETVISRVLSKDRDQRYRSIGELAHALAPFAPRRSRFTTERIMRLSGMDAPTSADAAPVVPANSPPAAIAASGARTHDVWSGTQSGTKRPSRWGWVALSGFGVAAAVGVGLLIAGADTGPVPAAASAPAPLTPPAVAPPVVAAPGTAAPVVAPAAPVSAAPSSAPSAAAADPPRATATGQKSKTTARVTTAPTAAPRAHRLRLPRPRPRPWRRRLLRRPSPPSRKTRSRST